MRLLYEDLPSATGQVLGISRGFTLRQPDINAFADLTQDHQWIHVDPVLAAKSSFGGTIAHGYLTLALVAPVISELFVVPDAPYAINYGLNRVRFPSPMPSGAEVRGGATVVEVEPMEGCTQVVIRVEMRIADVPKPVCVADSVLRFFKPGASSPHDVRTHPAYH